MLLLCSAHSSAGWHIYGKSLLCRYLASVDSPVTRALLALEPQHRHFYEAEQQAQYRLQHTAFCKAFWVR